MNYIQADIKDLKRRVEELEKKAQPQNIEAVKKEPQETHEITRCITDKELCAFEFDKLIKELNERQQEIEKIDNEIKELDKDDNSDGCESINTEHASEVVKGLDIPKHEQEAISHDCSNCTKKKYKLYKQQEKEKKKEQKQKDKEIRQQMKKIALEEQTRLSLRISRKVP